MEQNRKYRGEWCGTSHLKEKREELLKAHKEFLEMIADGYKIKNNRIKRHRIKKEKTPFKLFGTLECKFEIPVEILIKAGFK